MAGADLVAEGLAAGLAATLGMGFAKTLRVADRAGITETADAQIVTLPPLTWEPNLLDPDEPPEFLQLAKLGGGAKTSRLSMTARPRMELNFTEWNIKRKYRCVQLLIKVMHKITKSSGKEKPSPTFQIKSETGFL